MARALVMYWQAFVFSAVLATVSGQMLLRAILNDPSEASRLLNSIPLTLTKEDINFSLNGVTPLYAALEAKEEDIALKLIELGAEVNTEVPNTPNGTPLHIASANNMKKCVAALLSKDADVEKKDFHGYTPLFTVVVQYRQRGESDDVIRLLLNAGANPNVEHVYSDGRNSSRPLHHVASHWDPTATELLLFKGANVNEFRIYSSGGTTTALCIAMREYPTILDKKRTVKVLLDNGADIAPYTWADMVKEFWNVAYELRLRLISNDGGLTFDNFDHYISAITWEYLSNRQIDFTSDIKDLIRIYDEEGVHILYRYLKTCYVGSGEEISQLETLKLQVIDFICGEMSRGTNLDRMPLPIIVSTFRKSAYNWWKIERLSWAVVLIARHLNIGVDEKMMTIAYESFLESKI